MITWQKQNDARNHLDLSQLLSRSYPLNVRMKQLK